MKSPIDGFPPIIHSGNDNVAIGHHCSSGASGTSGYSGTSGVSRCIDSGNYKYPEKRITQCSGCGTRNWMRVKGGRTCSHCGEIL